MSIAFVVVCGFGAHERITFTEPAWIEAEVQNCGCAKFEERQRASVAVWYSPVCVLRVDKDKSTATCSATGDKYASNGECEPNAPADAIMRVRQDHARALHWRAWVQNRAGLVCRLIRPGTGPVALGDRHLSRLRGGHTSRAQVQA